MTPKQKMMKKKKKKVDETIKTLILNGVTNRHRSMFVIVGDKAPKQVVNLHNMLRESSPNAQPTVLWCSRDQLHYSDQKKLTSRGKIDPFSLLLETCEVTFCSYGDSQRVLGKTFSMCVLQDFAALTPNVLARTIETVEGGGLVVLMLRSLSSLTRLYSMDMDVHENFRTESHPQVTARFNERFLFSLASCKACIVMDDELNILPISSHMKSIALVSVGEECEGGSEADQDLKSLKEQLDDVYPVGPLLKKCCTLDQGKAVMTILDSVLRDKTLPHCTVALLAARGRGKSAALGLAIAGAVAEGYCNIFVTAPSPDDVKTLFDFVIKGFDLLEYKDPEDYDLVISDESKLNQAIVRINIYRKHKQTIQYIQPNECAKLSQVELLVVDEAAAIPVPFIESLVGPYLVFLSSTVHGYEGTGRALSKKLLQQLEKQSNMASESVKGALSGRQFKKIDLNESIRYASGDPIESWLNALLCLNATSFDPSIQGLPAPKSCDLYYVNRDTLFSYNKDSEVFLQRMMGLYFASHFKNSPNDLQLMADAPGHHLFVLLGPVDESKNLLPDILCVVQVCLEGQISRESAMKSFLEGHQSSGDQIPWKFCELFKDSFFPTLSGGRIVHIATNPSAMKLGYESAAVELLERYFEGQLTSISEAETDDLSNAPRSKVTVSAEASLLEENIKTRSNLEPLLTSLRERKPEKLHYLGVSFGLTLDLFCFWRKHKFAPFYLDHIPNNLNGDQTCMVLKPLNANDVDSNKSDECAFFGPFYQDFRSTFIKQLRSTFHSMHYKLAMSVLDPKINFDELDPVESSSDGSSRLNIVLSPYDLQRLEAYTTNLTDYYLIRDLVLTLSREYFLEKLPVPISPAQASVLLCMGLQGKDLSAVKGEMELERHQVLLLFMQVMKQFYKYLYRIASKKMESTIPRLKKEMLLEPHEISLDEDLNEAAKEVQDEMKAKMNAVLDPDLLRRFAIPDEEAEFENALKKGMKIPPSGVISLKSNRDKDGRQGKERNGKNKKRHENELGSSKKRRS